MLLDLNHSSAQTLRRAMRANALFSGVSGLGITLAEPTVLNWLGIQGLSIWPIGIALLIFSVYLLFLSRSARVPGVLITGVILGDWGWVVATAIILFLNAELFSTMGVLLLIDIAVVVAVFAIVQTRGFRRIQA